MEICSKPLGGGYVSRGVPGMLVHVYCVVVTEITQLEVSELPTLLTVYSMLSRYMHLGYAANSHNSVFQRFTAFLMDENF